ncbi:Protein CBG25228 [Caenorhabditis briggsae]|uniref:Protein CBG25228 n=1 Tax=Caenorhabditis briggsae TaxID=6238 RepID=B6IFJ8_CAEBR|nr:Protein CBG25228 [Caenorhabditis briggsae]CAR98678.1 Protein CBG25228 [Caenorhabditis briggsae]
MSDPQQVSPHTVRPPCSPVSPHPLHTVSNGESAKKPASRKWWVTQEFKCGNESAEKATPFLSLFYSFSALSLLSPALTLINR